MDIERVKYVSSLVYLDAGEAADLLRVNRKKVYSLVRAKLLPVTRIGRTQVFARADLDAFMARGEQYRPAPMTREAKRALAN